MEVSVSTWSFKYSNLKSARAFIDAAHACGIDALDLTLDNYYEQYYDWRNKSANEITAHFSHMRDYAQKKGVTIFQTHAPFIAFPGYLEEDFFDISVKAILATSAVGAKYCVFHTFIFPPSGKKDWFAEERDFNLRYLQRLRPYLMQYDVVLCLENLYDWDKGDLRKVYVSEPAHLVDYVDRLDGDRFGICLDTGHLHLFGGKMADAVTVLGKRLKVLHIHDNNGVRDEHLLPRMGTIDWNGFIPVLQKTGYAGTLNLEIKPLPFVAATFKSFELAKALTLGLR